MNLKEPKRLLYLYCAPVILVVIACLQFYLAHVHNLTPWKGGGFGMFSTVITQNNRFLRCYLITDEGDVPVEVPRHMKQLTNEIRSIPTYGRVLRLADQFARATWVPYDYNASEQVSVSSQSLAITADSTTLTEDHYSTLADASPREEVNIAPTTGTQPRFRIKGKEEPKPQADNVVNFYGVRIEVWGYQFDSSHLQINAYKILEVTVDRAR